MSFEKAKEAWLKASKEEKVSWINLYQSKDDHTYNKDYGVRGIPYNLMINSRGEIVAERLRGVALDEFLKKNLK